MITNVMMLVSYLVVMFFVGRLGDPAKTAGVGLATTFLNVIGFSIMFGTNCAQETLTS